MARIERFGLEAVPLPLRSSRWYDYLILQFSFSFNAGNFLLPALAVSQGHLSFFWAVASIVTGNFIAFLLVSYYAIPGVDYGIPGQYAARMTLGIKGSRFFGSLLRSLTSVYWFAVQSIGAAIVVHFMLVRLGVTSARVTPIAVTFALIMTVIAIIGFKAITSTVRFMLPIILLIMAVISILFLTSDSASFQWSHISSYEGENQWAFFFMYSGLTFAQYSAGMSGSADICRYARSRKDAFYGLLMGSHLGILVTASLAAYSVIAAGEWNPYVAAAGLTDSYWVLLLILCGVIVSMFSINLNNTYTGGFSLLNAFPKLNRIKATALIGFLGALLCFFPEIIDNATLFISILGSFNAPLAGVLITDYVCFKKMKLDVLALHDHTGIYNYFSGYNRTAFISVFIGFIYFHTVSDALSPGLTSCFLAGFLYFVINFRKFTSL